MSTTPSTPTTGTAPTLWTTVESPLGELLLTGVESASAPGGVALASLTMEGQRGAPDPRGMRRDPAAFAAVARQLRAYFAGELTVFDLEFTESGSAFQRRVWDALAGIPYGATRSYGELAEQLGVPREGLRALGAAIGANPLLVVRPCHRVIGADGSMRGYAGGVERKRRLLEAEGALQPTLY
ncbi:methylated-DNA--[protein]-cysteine S-methyltransferase [Streptomyces sp. NPDC050560]|uniref:methylated-DNA--[protein]-cysteine S-methyltransferase n=1 Tax=Streptomyces sp. NPDC050560 TaxID=3365630 RepID=UPI0037BD55C8